MRGFIAGIIGFVLLVGIIAFVMAIPVMLLWNYFMPDMFGLAEINFWQALALSLLSSMLFKSAGSSSGN